METIRCKFVCQNVGESLCTVQNDETKEYEKKTLYTAELNIVTDGSPENKKFFQWTPSGTLKVGLIREKAFIVGKEYYVDITPA